MIVTLITPDHVAITATPALITPPPVPELVTTAAARISSGGDLQTMQSATIEHARQHARSALQDHAESVNNFLTCRRMLHRL
jgi:hypothetical protein